MRAASRTGWSLVDRKIGCIRLSISLTSRPGVSDNETDADRVCSGDTGLRGQRTCCPVAVFRCGVGEEGGSGRWCDELRDLWGRHLIPQSDDAGIDCRSVWRKEISDLGS